jgi:predicted aconitase with swiveling domain
MRKLFSICCIFLFSFSSKAQVPSTVVSRVVFIGDAGEIDPEQSQVITHAAGQVLQGKTTVVYLGDNIYPRGMGLPGSVAEKETQDILRSQFSPMRAQGAKVYFIPGNHDWDKSGPQGLEKIQAQSAFLSTQQDPDLRMVPENGCPGPILLPLSENLSIVTFDSEWWVYPNPKDNAKAKCNCNSKEEVLKQMKLLAEKHKDQILLLAAHHPFRSYGVHGGRFSFMQHLFPLRDINKNLYIPLPLIGSIYPLIRRTFPGPEDLGNKAYKQMINGVDSALTGIPNLIHVAGHDHGLQFIKQNEYIQIVSGAGTKTSEVVRGKHALYGKAVQGYVVMDLFPDRSISIKFYEEQAGKIAETFKFVKHYTALTD